MIPTFEDVYKLTATIGSHASFEREECEFYYQLLRELPDKATVVEIGVQYGRSTSILAQLSILKHFDLHLIDLYEEDESPKAIRVAMDMLVRLGVEFTLYKRESKDVPTTHMKRPGLVLIDGEHSFDFVQADLARWTGADIIACHDYPRESGVARAVDQWQMFGDYEPIGLVGSLKAFRRKA